MAGIIGKLWREAGLLAKDLLVDNDRYKSR